MKTITELNAKIWYRFLKVVFIILVILMAGITIMIAFSEVGSYRDDFSVVCNYGNKNVFLAYDKQIYIPTYYNYSTSLANLSENTKKELQIACGISDEEINSRLDSVFKGTDDGKKFFDLFPVKVATSTYFTASLWSLLSIIVILVISEIIRRAFYYITLGNIRPHK